MRLRSIDGKGGGVTSEDLSVVKAAVEKRCSTAI